MKIGVILKVAEAQAQMKATLRRAQKAIVAGVRQGTDEAKSGLRAATRTAFKSSKLPNTWQSKFFGPNSFGPAGLIFSKAPEIMRAFSEGSPIKSPDGFFLAIPTENCPKSYLGKRVTPSNWPKSYYGPLEFFYSKSTGHSFLVASKPPGAKFRRREKSLRGVKKKGADNIMFILVPQVTLRKRLDPAGIVKAAGDKIPEAISAEMEKVKDG